MACRRQELTRRRKAVGFTQESLAEQLGVERSTIIRWEAGESEPLPSIRPNLARALQVSIDQLAELLATSEDAGTTRTLPAEPESTAPALVSEAQPQARPDGPELTNRVDPQVTEAVEALRRALRSADVSAENLAAMLLVGGPSQVPLGAPGPDLPAPPHSAAPNLMAPAPIPPVIEPAELQRSRANSRRRKRFAAVGLFVFALPAVWLSMPVMPFGFFSPSSKSTAPVHTSPTPNPANGPRSPDSTEIAPLAPIVTPVSGPAPPEAAAAPVPRITRATAERRSTRHATTRHHPSPRIPNWLPAAAGSKQWDRIVQIERGSYPW